MLAGAVGISATCTSVRRSKQYAPLSSMDNVIGCFYVDNANFNDNNCCYMLFIGLY